MDGVTDIYGARPGDIAVDAESTLVVAQDIAEDFRLFDKPRLRYERHAATLGALDDICANAADLQSLAYPVIFEKEVPFGARDEKGRSKPSSVGLRYGRDGCQVFKRSSCQQMQSARHITVDDGAEHRRIVFGVVISADGDCKAEMVGETLGQALVVEPERKTIGKLYFGKRRYRIYCR